LSNKRLDWIPSPILSTGVGPPLFPPGIKKTRPLTLRFSRRIALQCAGAHSRAWELRVCDAVANGTARPTGRRGRSGGPLVRFERTYARSPRGGGRRATLAVLAELLPRGCLALRILAGTAGGHKIGRQPDF
jgi:hypothetical protein